MGARSHNFKNVILAVDGYRVTGFGTDGVAVSWESDLVESEAGADGEVSISMINDDRGSVEFEVMDKSEAARILGQILATQRRTGVGVAVSLIDLQNGDTVSSADCFFQGMPTPSKGRVSGMHSYKILMPHARGVNNVTLAPEGGI